MKKDKAAILHDIANDLPQIFEWKLEVQEFSGYEMNLSAFGEHKKYRNDEIYQVEVPYMVAVEHKQQIKDAYKRGGNNAVTAYVSSVWKRYQSIALN